LLLTRAALYRYGYTLYLNPILQVTERFAFNRDTSMQRRDLRGGEQRARLRATEAGLLASIAWGEPHAGGGRLGGRSVGSRKGVVV
jgi:hypothetical protein